MTSPTITTLLLDVGGVLLSNGWTVEARNEAAIVFKLDGAALNRRHHLTFDIYEEGKLTLLEYLNRIIFYEKRPFSTEDFIAFMFKQSVSYPDTIDFFKKLKQRYGLKLIAVSNEGRELNKFRTEKYKLGELFDAFVSSSFVHFRKPDADIFRLAIDISQTLPENALYIDDVSMFVDVAKSLGVHGIHYQGLEGTKNQLEKFGFSIA